MAIEMFNLLGFTIDNEYYIQVTMPMGANCSCATYEIFSNFLEWCEGSDYLLPGLHMYYDNCVP